MKKVFYDGRRFKAPYGQFSIKELDSLVTARTAPTKNHPEGRPLGRNAILLWLFVVNRASSRRRQGFKLHESCLTKLIPKASSRYEAWKDLKHTGYIQQSQEDPQKWFLSIPGLSEVSDFDDDFDSEISESEEENQEVSEKTGDKKRKTRKDTYINTEKDCYRITEGKNLNSEKPLQTKNCKWLTIVIHMCRSITKTSNCSQWNQEVVDLVYNQWFSFDENGKVKYSVWNSATGIPDQFPIDEIIRCNLLEFGFNVDLFAGLHRRMMQTNEQGHCIK